MRLYIGFARAALLACIAWLLAACVIDGESVLSAKRAVDVPGLPGSWLEFGSDNNERVFITYTGGSRYRVLFQPLDRQREDKLFEDVYLVPVGKDHDKGYIASAPLPSENAGDKARMLFVVMLRRDMLELRTPNKEMLAAAAAKAGFEMADDVALPPGVTAAQVKKFFEEMAGQNFRYGTAYIRIGWFAEPGSASIDMSKADVELAAKRYEEAEQTLDYMADRGSSEAQMKLAALYAEGHGSEGDPMKAAAKTAFMLRSAYESGHPAAAEALGHHIQVNYWLEDVFAMEDAPYWFAVMGLSDPSQREKADRLLHDAVWSRCVERIDEQRAMHTRPNCVEYYVQLTMEHAAIDRKVDEVSNKQVKAALARIAAEKR